VREARRFLSCILAGLPVADDAILCVSELAANATIHSNSARPGGHFTVQTELSPRGCLRVEVQDQGGSWAGRPAAHDTPHGRGLTIVAQLARNFGRSGDSQAGWIMWFEMNWSSSVGEAAAGRAAANAGSEWRRVFGDCR
jgi:anti-sigma regulatory factor (Ser/Thr protein kinase)